MSARLNLRGATVLPYQFPSLTGPATTSELPPPAAPPLDDAAVDPGTVADAAAEEEALLRAAALAEARAEGLRRGFAEGREQGYAAGLAEGARDAEARFVEQTARLASIVEKLGAPTAAFEQPVEEAVAALALEVARCVIGEEVRRSREFLVRLVREAIAKVPLDMGAPRVLLHPSDLDLVRRLVPEIETGNAVLVGDDGIEVGGALVIADGDDGQIKDRRWNPRTADGVSQVNLTLSSRWRAVMLTLFDGEDGG